jgi:hypothetical protein
LEKTLVVSLGGIKTIKSAFEREKVE